MISSKAWKRKKRIERRKKALKPLSTEPPPPTMNPYRLEIQNLIKVYYNFIKIYYIQFLAYLGLSTFNKQTKRDILQFLFDQNFCPAKFVLDSCRPPKSHVKFFWNLKKTCPFNWASSWDDSSRLFWWTWRFNNDNNQTTGQTHQ